MKPERFDITGTTDASGNASITLKLPGGTGAWYDLKFALQLPSPAEWGISASGTPLTYGRGRRVTLGPELLQDGEVVTVSVVGGPPKAQVLGSANGKSGPPAEIMAGFTPSPNTIALDAFNISTLIGTINNAGSGDSQSLTIVLPGGSQGIGFAVSGVAPNQNPGALSITGVQTNLPYISMNSSTIVAAWATELFPEDTSVLVQVTGNAGAVPSITYIHAYTYNPRTRIQGSNSSLTIPVKNGPTPALWQAALLQASGGVGTLVSSVPSQDIYLFGWTLECDSTTGPTEVTLSGTSEIARILTKAANGTQDAAFLSGYEGGAKIPSGTGIVVARPVGTGNVTASVRYNQG